MTRPPGEETASPPEAEGAVPVCPRHPERESYVRCQRCERPVCPECQRSAAVGVQCVDCVREGAREGRAARTVFGGRVRAGRPVVTLGLIAICAAVYVLQLVPDLGVTARFAFAPPYAVAEPWRFLTSSFLHSQALPLHILLNMYVLWAIGPSLEAMFGRVRYLTLYLASAVGGSVAQLLLAVPGLDSVSWTTYAVGASDAVFGLFAALIIALRRLGRDYSTVMGLVLVNLLIGFVPGLHISWQAHLGGLVTGAALAMVLTLAPSRRRTLVQALGSVGVIVLLLLLTAAKVATVPSGLLL